MTFALFLSLAGIAVLDSLNPSLFIAQFFLLTTPKPVPRILAYIAGIVAVYIGGGMLILLGLREVIATFFSGVSPESGAIGQLAIGLALLVFGLWFKAAPAAPGEGKKPRSLSLGAAFIFGIVVNVNELTTALPYFVALEQIGAARLDLLPSLVSLLFYNLIFSLPLFLFLALFIRYRERFTRQLNAITRWTQTWAPRIMKYAAIIFGAVLALNGAFYFLRGSPLF
jgi:cytochrome c biogenesis protein CcdA